MGQTAHKQIIKILKVNDSKGIPFATTKTELLKHGYTDDQITHAVYDSSYDGKPNHLAKPDPLHEHYNNNPETTREIADTMLKDAAQHRTSRLIANGLASRFAPGRHAQIHYQYKFFSDLGVSWWGLFFLVVALFVASIYLDFSSDTMKLIFRLLDIIISVYLVYKLYKATKS